MRWVGPAHGPDFKPPRRGMRPGGLLVFLIPLRSFRLRSGLPRGPGTGITRIVSSACGSDGGNISITLAGCPHLLPCLNPPSTEPPATSADLRHPPRDPAARTNPRQRGMAALPAARGAPGDLGRGHLRAVPLAAAAGVRLAGGPGAGRRRAGRAGVGPAGGGAPAGVGAVQRPGRAVGVRADGVPGARVARRAGARAAGVAVRGRRAGRRRRAGAAGRARAGRLRRGGPAAVLVGVGRGHRSEPTGSKG